MRDVFKYVTSVLFVAIVVQVGFAGYGAFNAIDKAGKDKTVTKKTIENGFDPHGVIGMIVIGVLILLVLSALAGKVGATYLKASVRLLALGLLPALFVYFGAKSALL